MNAQTTIYGTARNAVNNVSSCTLLVTYTHDSVAPSVLSFVKASNQDLSTNSLPIRFTITFSEPIDASTLTASKITNVGGASAVVWAISNGANSSTFTVSAVASSSGTIQPRLANAAVSDSAGNFNSGVSDATDQVAYSPAALSVTLNQAAGQSDPTNKFAVNFTAVFSSAIVPGSFTPGDIVQTGSATNVTWNLSTADNITWTVAAASASGNGTIIPVIAANSVVDTFGNSNSSSTSNDNSVTYDTVAPTLTFSSVSPANPAATLLPTISGTASEPSTVTLFYDAACSTPKSSVASNSVFASPGITVTSPVTANVVTVIYANATDTAGNVSSCFNLVSFSNDSAPPAVTGVSSTLANGNYRVGQVVPIQVTFSKPVVVTGTPQLSLSITDCP